MRIVGGDKKGHSIAAPKGMDTRPTTDRMREALFNILTNRDDVELGGARIIDLFAGSGALGLEAISRGGSFCLFVDVSAAARAAIRDNQEKLSFIGCTRIHRRSATQLGPKPAGLGARFDLAFLDPPYGQNLVDPTLDALRDGGWLTASAVCVVEQSNRDEPPRASGFTLDDERKMGDSVLRFMTQSSSFETPR